MKRSFLVVLIPTLFVSGVLYSMQNGALNVTGAPTEGDCTGCHLNSATNSDPAGSLQLSVANNTGFYIPGTTYTVQVRVTYAGRPRFGFAVSARREGVTFVPVGVFSAGSTPGLQITDYVTHTLASIQGTGGSREWSFLWTAPDSAVGKITLYAAAVAADGNMDATGDRIYTQSLEMFPAASSLTDKPEYLGATVYPNPARETIHLKLTETFGDLVTVKLVDLTGKTLRTWSGVEATTLPAQLSLDMIKSGIYFLEVSAGKRAVKHRIVVY